MDAPRQTWIGILISLIVSVFAKPACAQSTNTSPASDSQQIVIEEIIVTATRRESTLQDTPLSVGVLSERTLEDSGALHIYDYWRMIPSLSVTDRGVAGNRFVIRGLSGGASNENDESLTAKYQDDTLLVSPQGLFTHAPSFKLVDIDRVEVLRGPQGTLFGAGSMGGAIRVITNKADISNSTQSYEALFSATAHGGTNYGLTAVLNMPLVEDRSAVRLAAYHFDDDGFIDDVGSGQNNVNRNTSTGFRLSGEVRFSDAFSMSGKIAYEDVNSDSFAFVDSVGKPSVGLNTTGDYQIALMADDFRDEKNIIFNLNLDYSTSIGDITSVTSYVESDTAMIFDMSSVMNFIFSTFHPATLDDAFTQKALMQEFRFASNSDGKFDWIAGVFYADLDFARSALIPASGINAVCGGCTGLPDGEESMLDSVTNDDRREIGVFADVSFWLTERLEANIGVRWYDLSRTATEISTGFFSNFADPLATQNSTRQFDDDGINGKGALSYHVNDDVMIYLLASQGFRAGGANELAAATNCNAPQTFDSDSLWSYEIGAKTRFLENRLTVNSAIYRTKWSDAQLLIAPACFASLAINSGGVTVDGLEIETVFVPSENWEFAANAGFTNPTLDKDIPSIAAPAGRTLAYVPDATASISGTYRFDAFANTGGFIRTDIQYIGSSFNEISDIGLVPRQELPSYSLVNFRVGLETDNWRVTLFADNIFDEQAIIHCCEANDEFTINRPRTIGARVRYSP